jgi:hypothetical protein
MITSTSLIDDRPTYGVAVATSGGAFAAEVEIDAQTGSAVVELGHRDARWAMPLAEDELAAVAALAEAVWADMIDERVYGGRFKYETRPPLSRVHEGGLRLRPLAGCCRLAALAEE